MTSSMPPYRLLCLKWLVLLGRNQTCPDFYPGIMPDVQASLRPEDRVVEFGCQGPKKKLTESCRVKCTQGIQKLFCCRFLCFRFVCYSKCITLQVKSNSLNSWTHVVWIDQLTMNPECHFFTPKWGFQPKKKADLQEERTTNGTQPWHPTTTIFQSAYPPPTSYWK